MNSKLLCGVCWVHFCLASISTSLFAQDRIIYGVVNAFDSIPLVGAEIFVKSTKQSFFTDSTGNFTVFCNSRDKLRIKADGFSARKVKITEQVKIVAVNLSLEPGGKSPEYDIGYGHVSEKDRTTATSGLSKNEVSFSRYSDIFEMIAGQFPGVEIRNDEIIIRGTDSFSLNSGALIVLDGVIVETDFIKTLRPVQIKNISVIKDGSTAVYGTRGANGVVLIETRKGGDVIQ